MIALLIALLVVALVLRLWTDILPLLQKAVLIAERTASLEVARVEIERLAATKPAISDEDPMPREFVEWAMQESSEWAREDKLARMRELYARLHDWPKVRNALMAEDDANIKSTF